MSKDKGAVDIQKTQDTQMTQNDEKTWAANDYKPDVDIWESDKALTIEAEVPGARKEDVELDLHDDVLTIHAHLALNAYEGLRPVYGEYNIGNYYRRFQLGEQIDQSAIEAHMADGVMTLVLPKKAKAQPRQIVVS